MKVGGTRAVGSTGAVRATGRTGAVAPAAGVDSGAPVRPALDVATVAGIPANEFTPKVREAIEMLMAEVQRMREELQQAQQRVAHLEKLADEDSLVPVSNRRAFVRELGRIMAYSERYGTQSSVLYFDIDGMKDINDKHGHAAGDAALKTVGEVLLNNVRESDVVGRLGGDEFGVILAQADSAAANEKATTLTAAIENASFEWKGVRLTLSVSYGAYAFDGAEEASTALDMADRAMYEQKQQRTTDPAN